MNLSEYQRKYSELHSVLPDDLIDRCNDNHPYRICIERDREDALELWTRLVDSSPADEIVRTYENNLHLRGKFIAFVAELWCYQALIKWLCSEPQVLDLPDTQGMPDFACEDFDVDATVLQEADEEYRVRRKLEDVMGDRPYIGILSLKSKFDVQATTGDRWGANEGVVDDFIRLIERDLDPDNPEIIETDALRVEFEAKQRGSFGWMGTWDRAREIEPDEEDKIPERLRTKADQTRNGRPLLVFMDCKHTGIDYANEVRDILIGEPYGFSIRDEVVISPGVQSISNQWRPYLVEIAAVPDPSDEREIARIEKRDESGVATHQPFPAIRPGDEGVFHEDDLDHIAGVMLRMKTGEVCYMPNVYTDAVDSKSIYDSLNWGLETRSLTSEEL